MFNGAKLPFGFFKALESVEIRQTNLKYAKIRLTAVPLFPDIQISKHKNSDSPSGLQKLNQTWYQD